MSKPIIYVGINALTAVNARIYMNHISEFYLLGKSGKYHLIIHTVPRTSIDRMRNECAKAALVNNADYLLFIDDDMVLSAGLLDSLIEADKDIVMPHTYIRSYPYHTMAFKDISEEKDCSIVTYFDDILEKVTEENKGVVDCAAVGFATVLIKTQLLKQLEPPYFITSASGTEDVYFCLRCKEEISQDVSIAVDTRVETGHLTDPEEVSKGSREHLIEFFKNRHGVIYKDNEVSRTQRGDRTMEYLESIEGVKDVDDSAS